MISRISFSSILLYLYLYFYFISVVTYYSRDPFIPILYFIFRVGHRFAGHNVNIYFSACYSFTVSLVASWFWSRFLVSLHIFQNRFSFYIKHPTIYNAVSLHFMSSVFTIVFLSFIYHVPRFNFTSHHFTSAWFYNNYIRSHYIHRLIVWF